MKKRLKTKTIAEQYILFSFYVRFLQLIQKKSSVFGKIEP